MCVYVVFWLLVWLFFFFFFNDTATTEIYTLSLHDALPNFRRVEQHRPREVPNGLENSSLASRLVDERSEEHTSELQSRLHLVCRLLLEKKKKKTPQFNIVNNNNRQQKKH